MSDDAAFELAFWYTIIGICAFGAVVMAVRIYQEWKNR